MKLADFNGVVFFILFFNRLVSRPVHTGVKVFLSGEQRDNGCGNVSRSVKAIAEVLMEQ